MQNVDKIPCHFPDRVDARRLTAKRSFGTKVLRAFRGALQPQKHTRRLDPVSMKAAGTATVINDVPLLHPRLEMMHAQTSQLNSANESYTRGEKPLTGRSTGHIVGRNYQGKFELPRARNSTQLREENENETHRFF